MSYRVYVVELARGAGRRRDPRIPWVYVGSSARDPELRMHQHLRGYRSSGLVKRHAVRLRLDLYDDLEPFRSPAAGRAAELERAVELAACGFVAHSDGVSHGKDSGVWSEWRGERVARVGGHVDAAAKQLRDCAFDTPSPEACARLLRGERGFWVSDYLDPVDPPPAYGQFAHVALEALELRLRRETVTA